MSAPANTNVGIARSTQLWEPETRLEGSFWREKLPSRSPRRPESPSAKTIGMERATRTMNTIATGMKSNGLPVRGGAEAGRAAVPGIDERRQAARADQDPSDHRREVEPTEVHVEGGRERLAVELRDLPAIDGHHDAERRDEKIVDREDHATRRLREPVGHEVNREVRPAPDSDRGADEGEPDERGLADLLHPEEIDARQVERGREPGPDVAQEDAQQH